MKFILNKSFILSVIVFTVLNISCNKKGLNIKKIEPQKETVTVLNTNQSSKNEVIKELQLELATGKTIKIIESLNYFNRLNAEVIEIINSEIIANVKRCGKSAVNSWQVGNIEMDINLQKEILSGGTAYDVSQGTNTYYLHSVNYFDCSPKESVRLKVKIVKIYSKKNSKIYNFLMLN